MPTQTNFTNTYEFYGDGCKVELMANGESSYSDVGVLLNTASCTLNWTETEIDTANAGKGKKQITDMTMDLSFELATLNPENIDRLGGGLFEIVNTSSTAAVDTIPDQEIAAGWTDNVLYDLIAYTSTGDSTLLKLSTTAEPTLTSVVLYLSSTSTETLVKDNDYVLTKKAESSSGWAISFMSANMVIADPTTYKVVIDYGSNTPIARQALHCGSSNVILEASKMKWTHTDSAGKERYINFHKINPNSGSFQFSFKGSNEAALESMPLALTAVIDSTLTDGRQLFEWGMDIGAL